VKEIRDPLRRKITINYGASQDTITYKGFQGGTAV
jgi:hypothetical protein